MLNMEMTDNTLIIVKLIFFTIKFMGGVLIQFSF